MRWRVLNKTKSKESQERREEIIEFLFKSRGLKTKKQQEAFLHPKNPYDLTPQDVGLSVVQLKKAMARIKKAIKNQEKIIVYGDYDADGVCATAIVWEALDKMKAWAMPFIPERGEGYGLKSSRVDQMAKEGVGLIITVDQGIVQNRQVAHAKKKKIDVIVTDHHVPGKKKPAALAIVHTTQLAGVGVAWFLAKELGVKPSLDLVTIGTITDMVPLLGPNRSIVKFGLKKMGKTKRPGLLALYDFAAIDKEKIGTYEVGFLIGPRLNAAGRMQDPMESLRLVCTRDENRGISLAQEINQRNLERQELTEQTTLHARKLWLKNDGQSPLIFVHHHSYQEGVVGLVASKLREEFYRPAVVLSQGKDWSKASARSIDEFNIVESIRACADLLGAHGGHPRAAGFSVENVNLETLKKRLIKMAEKKLDKDKLKPTLKIEAEIDLSDVNFELYKKIEAFAPFGMDNPQPVLATREVKVGQIRTVGVKKQHLKLMAAGGESGLNLEAIGFGLGDWHDRLGSEKPVGLAYNLLVNEWSGQKRLQLKLRDIKAD